MTNSTSILTIILYIMLAIMMALLIALVFVYLNTKIKEKQQEEQNRKDEGKPVTKEKTKTFNVGSIFDFMEFDKIEDNMIIQKKGKRFIMVVECQGINYDLMSQAEKVSVEEGFVQFLNTLSHPIQIYTQTRKINLESSLQTYKTEVDKLEQEYQRQTLRYRQVMQSPNATDEQRKQALYEYTKQKNLYEYGKDIIYNTEKMSLNKNILNKKYYVVIPYYSEEVGDYAQEEIREMAFSELYTKAQSIIRTLSVCGVTGKVMTSTELVDLLYVAYNRDDADVYGIDKALKAGYNELYSTAPDYMDKKMRMLDEQIARDAARLANEKVIEAQTEKQKEYEKKVTTRDDIISNLAQLIIEQNEAMLGKDIAEKSKEKVRREKKA
jgi:Ca2+/Na+ antiporter